MFWEFKFWFSTKKDEKRLEKKIKISVTPTCGDSQDSPTRLPRTQ